MTGNLEMAGQAGHDEAIASKNRIRSRPLRMFLYQNFMSMPIFRQAFPPSGERRVSRQA